MSAKELPQILVKKHDTRNPLGAPVPVRFPLDHQRKIEQLAVAQDVNRSDVVRAIVRTVLGEAA